MGELINGRTLEEIKHVAEWNCYSCGGLECDDCSYLDACTVENRDRAVPDALALIEHLEDQQTKWISVKDSLPDAFVSVLVQMPGEAPHPTVREGFISNDGIWCAGHFMREPDEVTHWAKMPEPPMEKERDVGA